MYVVRAFHQTVRGQSGNSGFLTKILLFLVSPSTTGRRLLGGLIVYFSLISVFYFYSTHHVSLADKSRWLLFGSRWNYGSFLSGTQGWVVLRKSCAMQQRSLVGWFMHVAALQQCLLLHIIARVDSLFPPVASNSRSFVCHSHSYTGSCSRRTAHHPAAFARVPAAVAATQLLPPPLPHLKRLPMFLAMNPVSGAEHNTTSPSDPAAVTAANSCNDAFEMAIGSSEPIVVEPKLKSRTTAVIMNLQARGVKKSMADTAISVFGKDLVFLTNSLEDAEAAVATILSDPSVQTVVPMGGDGTLTTLVELMCQVARKRDPSLSSTAQAVRSLPVVAYIPLGTGNAVGGVVGCTLSKTWWPRSRRHRRAKLRALFERIQQTPTETAVQSGREGALPPHPTTTTTTTTTAPSASKTSIVELPILEVTTHLPTQETERTDLCFFAGGTYGKIPVALLLVSGFLECISLYDWTTTALYLENLVDTHSQNSPLLCVLCYPLWLEKTKH